MDFYYLNISSQCHAVMLTARAVGVELNMKVCNVLKGEQMKPEFLNINFQHNVPTLVDGDFSLWESRAICTYLISKYGKDDTLYPKCPKQRAQIDRILYFDYNFVISLRDYCSPIISLGKKADPLKEEKIQDGLADLSKFLDGHDYAVGNHLTVADLCLVSTVAFMEAVGIDVTKHNNVANWFEKCKAAIPDYQTDCGNGAKEFGELVKSKM